MRNFMLNPKITFSVRETTICWSGMQITEQLNLNEISKKNR